MRKFIAPGVLSALFFLGFFYFIYNAESAKYEEKNETKPVKEYDETVIAQVNTEVVKTMQRLVNTGYTPQPQAYAPTETTETIVYEDAEPQAAQPAPTTTPETYVATSIPQVPSITIPSIPVSANIPSITPIAIPKIPTPQPPPIVQPAPVAPTQPKPVATQPRTTVS